MPSDPRPLQSWFKDRVPTPMQERQLIELTRLDAQCERCMKLPAGQMLCSGIRLTYDGIASEQYQMLKMVPKACVKLREKQEVSTLDKRIAASVIPARVVTEWQKAHKVPPVVRCEEDGFVIGGSPLPTLMYDLHTDELHKKIQHITLSILHAGYTARCALVPIILDRYHNWSLFISDFGPGLDFLALERFDMGSAPAYVADYLAQLLYYRRDNGLTTIVTVGDAPRARHANEEPVYAEMQGWASLTEVTL